MKTIPKDRSRRMQFFAWTCLRLAGRYRALGLDEAVRRLCRRADHFFEQAEIARRAEAA